MCVEGRTDEAGGGRVGLDVLLGVGLDHVPQAPQVGGVEDVEGLVRPVLPPPHVRREEVEVRVLIPLEGDGEGERERGREMGEGKRGGEMGEGKIGGEREREGEG